MSRFACLACLAAAVAIPLPGAALSLGGVFGGAIRTNGASAYWNPAAVVQDGADWSVHAELIGLYAHAEFRRAGLDPDTGEPWRQATFGSAVPNLALTLSGPTPWPWLRLVGGAFSASAAAVDWPEDGPQRHHATRSYVVAYAATLGAAARPSPDWGVALTGGPMYGLLSVRYALDLAGFANNQLPPGTQALPYEDPLLEGRTQVNADDWGWIVVLGAWARPLEGLRLGLGFVLPADLDLEGRVTVTPPGRLAQALPGFTFGSTGDIALDYALPWTLHAEAEATVGALSAALLGQYQAAGVRAVVPSRITGSEVEALDGAQLTVADGRDDWLVGLRVSWLLDPDWEVGARLDFDPLSTPLETMHAANLDFTTLHVGAGARWRARPGLVLALSYTAALALDNEVERSVFDPRAPPESGLGTTSANGTYSGGAHMLSLGASAAFGALGGDAAGEGAR